MGDLKSQPIWLMEWFNKLDFQGLIICCCGASGPRKKYIVNIFGVLPSTPYTPIIF
jgi:hypothetical protein